MANIYDRIADPTQGKLGNIGTKMLQIKQMQLEKESQDLSKLLTSAKLDQVQMDTLKEETRATYGITNAFIEAAKENPDLARDPQIYEQYMNTITQDLPGSVKQRFYGLLPDQMIEINRKSGMMLKAFEDRASPTSTKKITKVTRVEDDGTIYKQDEIYKGGDVEYTSPEYPVADDKGEGSEFERHIKWFRNKSIPMDQTDEWYSQNLPDDSAQEAIVRKKRLGTRAGLEQTKQQELTYKSTERERRRDIESRLRGEYSKGVDAYKSMSTNIEAAITAMSSGDTALADTMMAQTLSQVQESDVRAFAMYSQFDKSFGNILERTVKGMRRFLEGKRTPEERQEIQRTLEYMRDNYAEPKTTKVRDRYRIEALEENLNPFKTIPPESPEDIRDSTLIDKDDKLKLLRKYYPNQFRK